MKRLGILLLLLVGCPASVDEPPPDAGDEAFVRRALPLMWGRGPEGIGEVQVLVDLVGASSRADVVRAMARSPEYGDRWAPTLRDFAGVRRQGFLTNWWCHRDQTAAADGPELAAFLRDRDPAVEVWPGDPWSMADLARSTLLLDDLTPWYRGLLLTQFSPRRNQAQTVAEGLSYRAVDAERLLRRQLNRSFDCLPCHNSSFSVTDAADPQQDRSWPLNGEPEAQLFGSPDGGDPAALAAYFRRYGVVGAYQFSSQLDWYDAPPDRGCIPSFVPTCNGCSCEEAVCAVDSTCCSESWDVHCADLCIDQGGCPEPPVVHPWGSRTRCSMMVQPASLEPDLFGPPGAFAGETNELASVWDLQRLLGQGFEQLRSDAGLDDGAAAFAWLTAAALVDQVWEEAGGAPLTLSHGQSRNADQAALLQALTEVFVAEGFSLVELLAAIATHEVWNPTAPAEGDGVLPPLWDPFGGEVPGAVVNDFGDRVHAPDPRSQQRSLHRRMGWRAPAEFFGGEELAERNDAALQESLGVFLKEARPGFRAVGFEAMLAWEHAYGRCEAPLPPPLGCEQTTSPGCPGCPCEEVVCADRLECCVDTWDQQCTFSCAQSDAGCGLELLDLPDTFDALAAAGPSRADAVATVKDVLLGDPTLDDDERALFGDLLGDLSTPATESDIRAACGVLLSTPQWALAGDPGPDRIGAEPPVALPGFGYADRCEQISASLYSGGLSCSVDSLRL